MTASVANTSTVAAASARAAAELATTSPTPALDAQALLMHAAGLNRGELITRAGATLGQEAEHRYAAFVARRKAGEPVAYVTGAREFWSLDFSVNATTLIPRPETELLVEKALARIAPDTQAAVADLGTGCGAIAIVIASERPRARVFASDCSADALATARANALRLGASSIGWRHGNWLGAFADEARFDVIVANPPYVRADDPHLADGDIRFEPRAALVSGSDGLDAIRAIATGAKHHLVPAGWLLIEHGRDQAHAVATLLRRAGYRNIVCHRDLAGHERVTECHSA